MLSLRLLGSYEISVNGEPITTLDTQKGRALLAYLAVEADRVHPRDALAALLWPEASPQSALQNLRQRLYVLRKALTGVEGEAGSDDEHDACLQISRLDVRFTLGPDCWVDVHAFNTTLNAVERHQHRRLDACAECMELVEQAVALYTGDFLHGLTLPDANEFDLWREQQRAKLQARVLSALTHLTTFYERRREYDKARRFLQRMLELEPWSEETHRGLMRVLALSGRRVAALNQFEVAQRIIAEELAADLSPETVALYEQIKARELLPELLESDTPYKGLYPFGQQDAADYYGRAEAVRYLFEAVHRSPMVVVLGASGSGKSSAILAGLLPSLAKPAAPLAPAGEVHAMNGGPSLRWKTTIMRPGVDPFQSLAEALVHLLPETPQLSVLAAAFCEDNTALFDTVTEILALPSHNAERLLIFIDQFEELYTLCRDVGTRRRFVDLLHSAVEQASQHELPLTILASLRADFMSQVLTQRPLADVVQRGGIVLGPMTREELRAAIEEPARNRGVLFEPGLVDRLLDDVGEEPGNLPLLQFALTQLWARREDSRLTHAVYDEIGGVAAAVARYADHVFDRLPAADRPLARHLFTQLVLPGESTEDTRRPATRAEVGPDGWHLAQKLADLRLVVTGVNAAGEEVVELVHEALIWSWGRLRAWMDDNRDFRRWQQRLRTSLQQWQASGQEEDLLLRGAVLAEAEQWAEQRDDELSAAEQRYIGASIAVRNRQQAEADAARQRELDRVQALARAEHQRADAEMRRADLARTAGRRLRWLSAGLALALCVAVAFAIWAFVQQQQATDAREEAVIALRRAEDARRIAAEQRSRAEEQARLALLRQLIAQSLNLEDDRLDRALLLAALALDLADEPSEMESYFLESTANRLLERYYYSYRGAIHQLEIDPVRQRMVAFALNGSAATVLAWNPQDGRYAGELFADEVGVVAAISSDATQIAVTRERRIELIDESTGEVLSTIPQDTDVQITMLQFTDGDRKLMSLSNQGTVVLWDLASGRPISTVTVPDETENIVVSPDALLMAVTETRSDDDVGVNIWDLRTGEQSPIFMGGHTSTIHQIAFSDDSTMLATASFDGSVRLWNLATGELLGDPLRGHAGRVLATAFNPDGTILATGGTDHKIYLWDVATGMLLGSPLSGNDNWVRTLRFSRDGSMLYSGDDDGTVVAWNLASRRILAGHTGRVRVVAVNPDGRTMVTAGFDGRIVLRNAENGARVADYPKEHERPIIQGVFSPDGRILATADAGGKLLLWDAATRQLRFPSLVGHKTVIIGLAFSPNGRYLASGDFDGYVIVWDTETGEMVRAPTLTHNGWALSLAFSPDGTLLASGGTDSSIAFWNVAGLESAHDQELQEQGKRLSTSPGNWVTSLLFTHDGQLLYSGGGDHTIRRWDVERRVAVGQAIAGHTGQVWSLQFYPPHGEKTLISLGSDGNILFWDLATDAPLAPLIPTEKESEVMAVSPDGRFAYLGSFDTTALMWQLDIRPWRDLVCDMANRNLTDEEWERYVEVLPYRKVCPKISD
ncbi:MAG: PQQ-binding-like beta-propeller repeat protein [Caldilineaceae bacterium]|nr:PQQ-binding-like beta-propeller repeat protein [Caldilineaceae bacterium]